MTPEQRTTYETLAKAIIRDLSIEDGAALIAQQIEVETEKLRKDYFDLADAVCREDKSVADACEQARAERAALAKEKAKPRCDHCGSDRIYSGPPGCPRCGAPVCCEMCCKITTLEAQRDALMAEIKTLMEDKAMLDAFDLAGRRDDVQGRQISEDECDQELLGHFWQTPTVQSDSCREAIRASIGGATP